MFDTHNQSSGHEPVGDFYIFDSKIFMSLNALICKVPNHLNLETFLHDGSYLYELFSLYLQLYFTAHHYEDPLISHMFKARLNMGALPKL